MLKTLALFGSFFIVTAITMCIGQFIHWISDDYDYGLPWFITSLAFGFVMALIIVNSIPVA